MLTDGTGAMQARVPRLVVLGLDHSLAAADVRAAISLDEERAARAIASIRRTAPNVEALVLSTCNRTELVLAGVSGFDAHDLWHHVLMQAAHDGPEHGSDGRHDLAGGDAGYGRHAGHTPACLDDLVTRQVLIDDDAARHLFRVTAGLESQLIGDQEIIGQVRRAAEVAGQTGGLGKTLHKTVRMAVETGKLVRSATSISAGGAGIGAAVASEVARWEAQHGPARVLLLGAGAAARSVATQLGKHTQASLTLANRTRDRAAQLARRHGAGVCDLADVPFQLDFVDVVVAATGAQAEVLDAVTLSRATIGRDRPLLALDAGVPPQLGNAAGVERRGVDQLRDHRADIERRRTRAMPEAERLVDVMVADWERWRRSQVHEARIAGWYRAADAGDLERLAAELGEDVTTLAPLDRRALRAVLHDHTVRLRGGLVNA